MSAAYLGNLGTAYSDLGDYRKAISFYEKALAIAEEIGDKQGKGSWLGNLGRAYGDLGDYRKAISFGEKALAIAEEIGDKKGKGNRLGNLGLAYSDLGDYRKAISFYEKGLAIAEEIGDKKGKGYHLGNMGNAYKDLGDYRKAISFYEKALAIAEEIGDKQGKGNHLGNMGNAYSDLGDYRQAIGFHEKAIDIYKEIGVSYSISEGNLADAYLELDRDDEALAIYTKQNHSIRLGRYYLKKREYARARKQFDRDREKDEEAKKASFILPQWIGLGLSNEGLKEYQGAYKWYTKAITFMEEQRAALTSAAREHYFEGKEFGIPRIEAYEGAVRTAFMLGKYDEAFFWAENTRGRITSELLSSRHSGSNSKISANLAKEEEELSTQIMMNKKQQQIAFEKNNPELLKQLEAKYPALKTKMDNLIDRLRKEHPQYAAIKYPQPVKLSQLALKPGETIIEYEVTDPYSIGLVIRDGKVIKSFKVDKTRKELEALIKKFRSPFQEGADINSFSTNQATQLADLLIKPALSAVKKGDRLIIVPDESLALLPFESLLLSAPADALKEEATLFAQAAKQTEGDTVDKDSIIRGLAKPATNRGVIRLSPRVSTHILFNSGSAQVKGESDNQLKEILAALTSNKLKGAKIRIEGHTDSVGDAKFNLRLSQKRAKTIYDYLTKNGIPAEHLNYTGKGDTEQIASNSDEKGRKQNRRVDFVRIDSVATNLKAAPAKGFVYAMDEYPISYYQSASVLSLQRGLKIKRATDKSFFGLGDPVFDTTDSRSSGMRGLKVVAKDQPAGGSEIANNEETKDAGYQFGRLVNTEKEVKEVGKLFSNAKLLTGADASEETLKGEDLSAKRYLLFSTHGILGNEIPYIKQPALVLNLVGNDKEDGFLTASEILNLNLNADVVCLSACKTGLGVQSAGEGVVGLSRAFMYAGTDTVLVSLWSVADESTYKLMVKFFEGVKSGKDKMTALKEAKNYLRKNGYDNPFYWAPFILMGEAR
jgi:CHAT domain-containing protein